MEVLMFVLMILKWIGIILLSVLGFILCLILLILLCPIRYQAEGDYQEKVNFRAQIRWFLGVLKVDAGYSDQFLWEVRVFGIRILPAKIKNSAAKKSPQKDSKVKGKKDKTKPEISQNQTAENLVLNDEAKQEHQQQENTSGDESLNEEKISENTSETKEKQSIHKKISDAIQNWKYKITNIKNTIQNVRKQADHYLAILKRAEVQRLIKRVLRMFSKMLMHIRPRKLSVIAHVGMEDPSLTGSIMAVQGILYPWVAQKVVIIPYFEEKRLEGSFYLAGHTILGVLLVLVLRMILNKDFLTLIRLLRKKEDPKNGRA